MVAKSRYGNSQKPMIEKPWLFARNYCENGSDILTFHLEACPDQESVLSTIQEIRSCGVHPGLSIKPATPASKILPYLELLDLILVMSVEPGKGGQAFLPTSLAKIALLKKEALKRPLEKRPLIEVDGGINEVTGPLAVKQGADLLVAGSYLYGHDSIICRNVKIAKGAKITRSIILSNVSIGTLVTLSDVVIDKYSIVTARHTIAGDPANVIYLKQGAIL